MFLDDHRTDFGFCNNDAIDYSLGLITAYGLAPVNFPDVVFEPVAGLGRLAEFHAIYRQQVNEVFAAGLVFKIDLCVGSKW